MAIVSYILISHLSCFVRVIFSTVFGAMIAGQVASMAPDYVSAKVSAARCFAILDREPLIDAYDPKGEKLVSNE